jgi:hypothetical protein
MWIVECGNWETEHYTVIVFWKERGRAVSFLGKHKSEPDIDIGFLPALHLQSVI